MSPPPANHPFPNPPPAVRRGSTPSAGGKTRMLLPSEATQPHPALQGVADTSGSFTLSQPWRPAWAEVDLNAIRHNVGLLSRLVAPAGLMAVVKADGYVDALAKAAADAGTVDPQPVHLKVDTGMHRIGCSPSEALDLAPAIRKHRELHLQGLLTHFAVADEPDNPFTTRQVAVFDAVRKELARAGIRPPLVHAANSAGVLTAPEA